MFKKILFLPVLAFVTISGVLKADIEDFNSRVELLKNEVEALNKTEQSAVIKASLKTNAKYLEHKIRKKIKRMQARIEKYKANLDYSLEQEEYQKSLDKINAAEKRLQILNEVLSNIESMRSKLSN